MKLRTYKSGLSLVELLVVITVIIALVGLVGGIYTAVRKKGARTKSEAIAIAVEKAINDYHNAYGKFPPPASNSTAEGFSIVSDSADMNTLLLELLGETTTVNYKGTAFLDLDNARGGVGVIIDNSGTLSLLDPKGETYELIFNTTYDPEGITIPAAFQTSETTTTQATVIVFNSGIDRTAGTPDDVKTWE